VTTAFVMSSGSATAAVRASPAFPAVFPAVGIDGGPLFDGGVVDNTLINHAISRGADRVVVLSTGDTCALTETPTSGITSAVHAPALLIQQRLALDVSAAHDNVDLVVLPPLCPLSESATNFGHSGELVACAGQAAGLWLDEGGDRLEHPERFLSRLTHDVATSTFADVSGGHTA
jgi:NTE family protein